MARQWLEELCQMYHVSSAEMNNRGRHILKMYRKICWSAENRAYDMQAELTAGESKVSYASFNNALINLEIFASENARSKVTSTVDDLFATKYLLALLNNAAAGLRSFPQNGEIYYQIIKETYMRREIIKETEILEHINLERSQYYARKKEATILFAIILWKTIIPEYKERMSADKQRTFLRQVSN